MNQLTSRADDSLYKLAHEGPGVLYKKPSPLHFCAAGGEVLLPDRVDTPYGSGGFWRLSYPDANLNMKNVGPDVSQIDWTFIIGYILSLIALIFTFDAISGEREHGTLRLMLANAIPRHTVLIGKFLGALVSVSIPFLLAMLVNLLMISSASKVHLNTEAWGRLGIILFIALMYTCLFLALGLLVSARVQRSAVSLVILLLTWVTFVAFMPSTLAALASGFSSSMAPHEYTDRYGQSYHKLRRTWRYAWYQSNDEKMLRIRGEWHTKIAVSGERLAAEYLTFKITQVQRARAVTQRITRGTPPASA